MNKSAFSCLLTGLFASAGSVGIFAVAFFREKFSMPLDYAVVIVLLATTMYIIASLVIGRLANRIGTKPLTIAGSIGSSVLLVAIFFMPNLFAAVATDIVHVWFAAAAITAFSCLALDQVPNSRGTMMSMRSLFISLGGAIGAAVGGTVLFLFSYQALGIALGGMGFAAAALVFFLVDDPNKPKT